MILENKNERAEEAESSDYRGPPFMEVTEAQLRFEPKFLEDGADWLSFLGERAEVLLDTGAENLDLLDREKLDLWLKDFAERTIRISLPNLPELGPGALALVETAPIAAVLAGPDPDTLFGAALSTRGAWAGRNPELSLRGALIESPALVEGVAWAAARLIARYARWDKSGQRLLSPIWLSAEGSQELWQPEPGASEAAIAETLLEHLDAEGFESLDVFSRPYRARFSLRDRAFALGASDRGGLDARRTLLAKAWLKRDDSGGSTHVP